MPRLRLPLVLALAILVLAACGDKASDEKDVKETVKGVYNALADKDADKVCDSISDQGKERISSAAARGGKKESCEHIFGLVLAFGGDSLKEARDVDVTDVKVDDDQANATVKLKDRKSEVGLVKEHGDWKLSGLDVGGN